MKMADANKNLTKPKNLISTLSNRTLYIRETSSYWQGMESAGTVPPRNILLFTRLHKNSLIAGALCSPQHHRFALVMNFKSDGTLYLDDQQLQLPENSFTFIFPFQTHYYSNLKNDDLRWLFITFELEEYQRFEPLRFSVNSINEKLLQLLNDIVDDWQEERTGIGYALGRLLETCLRNANDSSAPRQIPSHVGTNNSIIQRVHQVIHQAEFRDWRIEYLAHNLSMSAGHLRSCFREETSMSLGNYLRMIRMNRAAGLLANSKKRVLEIADACGFSSPYAFSRAFSQYMEVSPREYRKRHRQER